MSRKFLLLALLPLLASCTGSAIVPMGPAAPKDFNSLYKDHVKAQVSSVRDFLYDLGYKDSYNLMGSIKAGFSVPEIMSGNFTTDYTSQVQGHDASIALTKPHASYEMILGTGVLDIDEVSLVSKAGDTFFRLSGMKPTELIDAEVQKILQKYDKVWLSMTAKDIEDSMSGSSEADIMSYKISRAIASMTLTDIESYMSEYPVWKNTKDLGVSGGIHTYSVELDKKNIIAMMDSFVKKATGSPLDDVSRNEIVTRLSDIDITGTMTFDESHSDVATFSGVITSSGSVEEKMTLLIKETKDTLNISSNTNGKIASLELMKSPVKNTISLIAKEKDTELLSLSGEILKQDKKISSVNLVLASQGMTAELMHKNLPDGNFDGKLNFGIGNLTWKGALSQEKLTSLVMAGAMIGKSISLELSKASDDLIQGPFVIKSGSEEITRANVGLRLVPERFSIMVDLPMSGISGSSGQSHVELDVTAKTVKTPVSIVAPSPVKSFKTLSDELSAIVSSPDDSSFDELPITNQ